MRRERSWQDKGMPLQDMALAAVFLGERPSKRQTVGMSLALCGIVVIGMAPAIAFSLVIDSPGTCVRLYQAMNWVNFLAPLYLGMIATVLA